jgi:phospho-N-acetylmuramoyl-pentapeptide-transferase
MLSWLFVEWSTNFSVLNVFRYITVRSAAAAATSFLLCLLLGPRFIRWLKALSFQQHIREEGPKSHQGKSGTPTMGGLLILLAIALPTVMWADLDNAFTWMALLATLGFGLIGFIDDFAKITKRRNLGLSARAKFIGLLLVCLILAVWMYERALADRFLTELHFPFFKQLHPDLGIWYIPFAILVLLASTNAVNLTDGLDGLAIGSSGIAFATYTAIAYVAGHGAIAHYLDIPHILAASDLAVFGGATCGACVGFLWFNAHPAEVFMGDTGALALGGALGTMALLTGHPLLLVVVGGLFVMETLSVILQVSSYRMRKKRIFLMAPIHHHFELKGWHESKVIIRFWIISLLLALLAVSTFKLR